MPAPIALVTLLMAIRYVPAGREVRRPRVDIDYGGAVSLTAAMHVLLYTLVEVPQTGWGSARTLGGLVAAATLLTVFVVVERTVKVPLIRLGILRSATLLRANLAAMALAGWIRFQFILVLYMQELRGWSALTTGLAIFPSGLLVASISPRMGPVISRFGFVSLTVAGLLTQAVGYALFQRIGLNSSYLTVLLPGFLLGGLGFAIAYSPVNVAAIEGVPEDEQGLAGGLLNTSFQFGGALVLALMTVVAEPAVSAPRGTHAILHGFRQALLIPFVADLIAAAAMAHRRAIPTSAQRPPKSTELATGALEGQMLTEQAERFSAACGRFGAAHATPQRGPLP